MRKFFTYQPGFARVGRGAFASYSNSLIDIVHVVFSSLSYRPLQPGRDAAHINGTVRGA